MCLSDAIIVAKEIGATLGAGAVVELDRRAVEHEEAGDTEGATFWRRVALAVRLLTPSADSTSA